MTRYLLFLMLCSSCFAAPAPAGMDELCAQLDSHLQKESPVAVLPFDSRVPEEPQIGVSLSEYLVSCLSADSKIQLVERMKFAHVMQERDLAQSDLIDSSNAPALGELLGARTLLVGSVANLLGQRIVIVNVVDAGSGKVVYSARKELEAEPLRAFSEELLGESSQVSAVVFRSAIVPGWGDFYANKPIRGSIWLGLWATGVGATIWGFVSANQLYDDYESTADLKKRNLTNSRVQDILADCGDACLDGEGNVDQPLLNQKIDDIAEKDYQRYEDRQNLAVAFAIGTGVIWAANVVDAILVGRNHKRKVDLYFAPMAGGKGAVAGARTSF